MSLKAKYVLNVAYLGNKHIIFFSSHKLKFSVSIPVRGKVVTMKE